MFYTCLVCGFGRMPGPPEDYTICPCCGTQFGYDDVSRSHRRIRNFWLQNGAHWFSAALAPDPLWNGFRQVAEAGLPYDVPNPVADYQLVSIPVPDVIYSSGLSIQAI